MDFNLKDFFGMSMTDTNYANSVARWLTVQTENAQAIISAASDVALIDDIEDIETYVSELPSDVKNTPLIFFPESDDVEAQSFTTEQVLEAYGGVEVQGLDAEKAQAILHDLAGSTAAVTAAAVGINELCSRSTIMASDLVASIEAQVGGISDQMLSVTSVIAPVFSDERMALRDKVKAVMGALGLIGNDDYDGFGPIHSDINEMTGVSGVLALANATIAVVTTPVNVVLNIGRKVLSFIDSVFGGIITKTINAVAVAVSTIFGTNDACKTRADGDFTDLTCDNADTCIQLPASMFSSSQLEKISYKYATHINAGFGAIDIWFADSTLDTVNLVIHWKPIDQQALLDWANEVHLDEELNPYWTSFDKVVSSKAEMNSFITDVAGRMYEMETQADKDLVRAKMAAMYNTQPAAGSAGVSDASLYYGILASQILTFALWNEMYAAADLNDFCDEMESAGFYLYRPRPFNIRNVDIVNLAALSTSFSNIVHEMSSTQVATEAGTFVTSFFLGVLTAISTFDLDVSSSLYVPYYYIASFQTGKYSIISDAEVQQRINVTLTVVGLIIVTILAIKIALSVKKKLWVAQTSLDFQAFEVDVATDASKATELYKRACRLARANTIIAIITGSAKSAVSKVATLLSGLGNTITGRVGGLLSTGSADAPASESPTSLDTVVHLISGQ